MFFGNDHKIVWTAITHSSHNIKVTDFKTGKMLTEKLWKGNKNWKKLVSLQIYNLFPKIFQN